MTLIESYYYHRHTSSNGPQRYLGPNPLESENITLHNKRDFADGIKNLEMGNRSQIIRKWAFNLQCKYPCKREAETDTIWKRKAMRSQKQEGALEALKMKEAVSSPRAGRSRKIGSPRASRGSGLCLPRCLGFSPVKLITDAELQNYKSMKVCSCRPLGYGKFVTAARGNI